MESDYDQNGNSISPAFRTYGKLPVLYQYLDGSGNTVTPSGWALTGIPLQNNSTCSSQSTTWPFATVSNTVSNSDGQDLRQNPPLIFRRALKLVNGKTISLGTCNGVVCGLTVASENPVYVQGDYNNPGAPTACTPGNFATCFPNPDTAGGGVPASISADAVTVLSNAWNDVNSFISPYAIGGRTASTQTTYRTAIAAGKSIGFPNVGTSADTGSDGGVHNFLRYLEDWSGSNLWYQGSFVALFYNHQGVGSFKCCTNVYGVPHTRNENFDTTFQTPANLPPRTPMLRNVNTIGFTQELMPTQ
ncbi:MAG TPA: hypothetical protein VG322_05305 [Candidatus Acidoferrales bacterium]|nr:hypothetical protein [Candidatus Acidoferrales bacterium]